MEREAKEIDFTKNALRSVTTSVSTLKYDATVMHPAQLIQKNIMKKQKPYPILRHDKTTILEQKVSPGRVILDVFVEQFDRNQIKTRRQIAGALYGSALPLTIRMEEEILSQFHRLPGVPSVNFGLEAINGKAESLHIEDFMGLPENSPDAPDPDLHRVMEKKLGINPKVPLA